MSLQEEKQFEKALLRDMALARGENPDDPAVMAKLRNEREKEKKNNDEDSVCSAKELNVMFVELLQLMGKLEDLIIRPSKWKEHSLKQILWDHTISFSLDLIAADGVVAKKEADFLNEMLGINHTPAEYAQECRYRNEHCFTKDPVFRTVTTAVTKGGLPYSIAMVADNGLNNGEVVYRALVLKFYLELAKAITLIDGQLSEEEAQSLSGFTASLSLDDNDDNTHGFIFVNNTGDVRI